MPRPCPFSRGYLFPFIISCERPYENQSMLCLLGITFISSFIELKKKNKNSWLKKAQFYLLEATLD